MGSISKAQADLSGTGIDSDEPSVSLVELEKREDILNELIQTTKLQLEGALNPILASRVQELSGIVSRNIGAVLYNLVSGGGLSQADYESLKGLTPHQQTETLLKILGKEAG